MHSRRDLFGLVGGAIWLAGCAVRGKTSAPRAPASDGFLVVQISDTHLGYTGPANPDPAGTLERAFAEITAWPERPALIVHTGDVSQMTTDAGERARRLRDAKRMLDRLGAPVHVLPGEHDASLDAGAAFRDVFGASRWSLAHRGVQLIGLDNSSGSLGDEQLAWLARELDRVPAGARVAVFAHRPLFPLAQAWDWFTADGDRALALLDKHPGATVFYGHIHQAHVARTGTTTHVSARALVFPLPAPGSQPDKKPLAWDASAVDHGLGYRGIVVERGAPAWVDRALV